MAQKDTSGEMTELPLTLEEMVDQTPAGETLTFNAGHIEGDEHGDFFQIRSTYLHDNHKLAWLNALPLEALPRKQTVNQPARGVEGGASYNLEFTGNVSKLADFYNPGTVCFISDRLLAILMEFDPAGVDAVAAPLRAGDGVVGFNVFMPARTLVAPDVQTSEVSIAKRLVFGVPVAKVILAQSFRLNPNIDNDVHIFADLAEPQIYWSRSLVEACRARGISGVSARTGYARTPETIEM